MPKRQGLGQQQASKFEKHRGFIANVLGVCSTVATVLNFFGFLHREGGVFGLSCSIFSTITASVAISIFFYVWMAGEICALYYGLKLVHTSYKYGGSFSVWFIPFKFKEGLDGREIPAKRRRASGLEIVNFVLGSSILRPIIKAFVCFKLEWAILSCMFTLGVSVYVLCVLDGHSDREADGDDYDILNPYLEMTV
jgi:hypothetical protein